MARVDAHYIEWRTVQKNDHYEVSDNGEVRSLITGKTLAQFKNNSGYYRVSLWRDNSGRNELVHRLVAEAFIPNPLGKRTVNHKDGDKSNNSVENLEWMTGRENTRHASTNGLLRSGENHQNAKLNKEQVKFIKDSYRPKDREFGQRAMARKFGVSQHAVYDVLRGATWGDV